MGLSAPRRRAAGGRRARRRRLRLAALLAACAALSAAAVVAAFAYRDVRAAQREADRGRADLAAASARLDAAATDPAARQEAGRRLAQGARRFERAHRALASSGPVRVAAALPGVGYQREGALQLLDDGRAASTAGARLVTAADRFAAEAGRTSGGTVPVAAIGRLEEALRDAARELRRVSRGRRGLWGPLGDARVSLDLEASGAARRLTGIADAAGAARGFAGEAGQRRYLLAGLNNAEMRDQGMVLSVAVVRLDRGRASVEDAAPVSELPVAEPVDVELPPGTARAFGSLQPRRLWQSVNATADTPLTGRLLRALHARATGDPPVDGVIAVDVPALATLLAVTGPVDTPAGRLDTRTAAPLLLRDQYAGLPVGAPQAARREQVAAAARAVLARLVTGDVDTIGLARRLGEASAGRHLWVWSAEPGEQSAFERVGLAGLLVTPDDPTPTFHVAVQDATGTKVSAYAQPSVHVAATVTPAGTVVVRTTVRVRNGVPAGAAPSYALGPNNASTSRPGQLVARVHLWAPAGAEQADAEPDAGLQVVQQPLVVEPGTTAEVTFETLLPRALAGPDPQLLVLRFAPQPWATPVPVEVSLDAAGRRVGGPLVQRSAGGQPSRFRWLLHR